jgi:hypothetical protein
MKAYCILTDQVCEVGDSGLVMNCSVSNSKESRKNKYDESEY